MLLSTMTDCLNSINSAYEVYEWLHDPPVRYFAYVKVNTDRQGYGTGTLTTWTGEKLGTVHLGRQYRSGFGYGHDRARRSITVVGTNGKRYYGTYYEGAGDYARIKQFKEGK